jgi:hypothetical protein
MLTIRLSIAPVSASFEGARNITLVGKTEGLRRMTKVA